MKSCTFCGLELITPKDLNLVAGSGEFRPIDAILQLPFVITNNSPYVCRKCKGNLKSYIQAKEKFSTIEEQLRETYLKCGLVDCANSHDKHEPKMENKEIQTNSLFVQNIKNPWMRLIYDGLSITRWRVKKYIFSIGKSLS